MLRKYVVGTSMVAASLLRLPLTRFWQPHLCIFQLDIRGFHKAVHKFDEVYRGPSAAINTRAPVGANNDQQQQHWKYFDSQPGVESICKRPPNLSRKHISVLIFKKWKPPTEPPAFLPSKFGRQDHPFTLNWWCIGTTRKVTHLGFPDRGEGFKGDLCVFSTEAMPSRCFPQFAIHFPPMTQCHLTSTENLLLVPF